MLKWILTALCTASSLLLCLPKYVGKAQPRLVWKCLGTASALPMAVYGAVTHGGSAWLCVAALILSAAADVMLEKQFIAGMALFASAHICYITWFLLRRSPDLMHLAAFAVLAFVAGIVIYNWSPLMKSRFIPYCIYGFILCLMGACAVGLAPEKSLSAILAAIGGIAFVISDILVCKGTLMRVTTSHHWITMSLYYGAQLCFGASCALMK